MTSLPPLDPIGELIVGDANRLAVAALRRIAENPARVYNPLCLIGPPGSGKTHLLRSAGTAAGAFDSDLSIRLVNADSLAEEATRAFSVGHPTSFRTTLAGLDILLIDNLDGLPAGGSTQRELATILTRMLDQHRQVVVSATRSPAEIEGLIPELRAALATGLTVELEAPDEPMRRAVAARIARVAGLELNEGPVETLARYGPRHLGELHALIGRLVEMSADRDRRVGIDDIHRAIGATATPLADASEFGAFLTDISREIAAVVETDPWRRRIAEAILRWEGAGVRTARLESALASDTPPDVDALLEAFERDAVRLLELHDRLGSRPGEPPLDDPDELAAAERLFERSAGSGPEPGGLEDPGDPSPASERPIVDPWFLNRERVVYTIVDVEGRLLDRLG